MRTSSRSTIASTGCWSRRNRRKGDRLCHRIKHPWAGPGDYTCQHQPLPPMIPKSMQRFLGYGVIVLGLLGTLAINLYTLAQVVRARTNVPWAVG